MRKLLSVLAVLAIVLTVCSVPVFAADTTVYLEYNGADYSVDNHTPPVVGTSIDIDYYERDAYAPMTDDDKASLEVGKVYKAVYIFTFNDVAEPGWEIKFMPTEEYYYNITNGDIWQGEQGTKTVVVVPFKVTNNGDVKLKYWQHGGLKSGSTLDKVMIVGADFNAYSIEDVDILMEGVANAGSNAENNKPAAEEWTVSDPDAVVEDGGEGEEGGDITVGGDENENEGTGDNNEGAGDNNENEGAGSDVPATGDASVVLAIVAAGAAALGGLKLRKR